MTCFGIVQGNEYLVTIVFLGGANLSIKNTKNGFRVLNCLILKKKKRKNCQIFTVGFIRKSIT
jgi:hypothetical protein